MGCGRRSVTETEDEGDPLRAVDAERDEDDARLVVPIDPHGDMIAVLALDAMQCVPDFLKYSADTRRVFDQGDGGDFGGQSEEGQNSLLQGAR